VNDGGRDGGRVRLNDRGVCSDEDALRDPSHLQGDVAAQGFGNVDVESFEGEGAEAFFFDGDGVGTGRKRIEDIASFGVGCFDELLAGS
jgi:hypothetical protein